MVIDSIDVPSAVISILSIGILTMIVKLAVLVESSFEVAVITAVPSVYPQLTLTKFPS